MGGTNMNNFNECGMSGGCDCLWIILLLLCCGGNGFKSCGSGCNIIPILVALSCCGCGYGCGCK